ncbi:MAG: putative CRISPR-associated protein [Treponema sp.]|jgi:putative CRISPR-associated protein (TIGR02619 family)|nr:putative CRISPR-associated protein [Treponema sp.]
MQKLLICTVGTSISNDCEIQKPMMKKNISWEDADINDGAELRRQIIELMKKDDRNPCKKENLRKLGAEMNVLSRLDIEKNDRIVLLASDNAFGKICTDMVKYACVEAFGLAEGAVEVRRIEGLQVLDARKLRETGLKNLVRTILEYVANDEYRWTYDIILNPTGGFKGVVPFITILGMLYGRRCVYLFEFADELINLPPLPFSFDMRLYSRVRPALAYIEEEVAVSEEAFLSRVINYTPAERDLFMSFTESFDDHNITISALAYCLHNIDKLEDMPMIAESALEYLSKIKGNSVNVINRLIKKSANPFWRDQHIHTVYTSDLLIIKQSRTSERIAGFIRNGKFFVTTIFDNHDDYAANIGKYKIKDYENARFVSFDYTDSEPEDDTEYNDIIDSAENEAVDEQKLYIVENKQLKQKLKETETTIKEIAQRLEETKTEREELAGELTREKEYAGELKKQLDAGRSKGFFALIRKLFRGKE